MMPPWQTDPEWKEFMTPRIFGRFAYGSCPTPSASIFFSLRTSALLPVTRRLLIVDPQWRLFPTLTEQGGGTARHGTARGGGREQASRHEHL